MVFTMSIRNSKYLPSHIISITKILMRSENKRQTVIIFCKIINVNYKLSKKKVNMIMQNRQKDFFCVLVFQNRQKGWK